jgi:hypothetical protein
MSQPVGCDLPHPERSASGSEPQVEARLENGAPEYPANTNSDAANAIPPGAMIRRPLNSSCGLPLEERGTQGPGTGTSWKTLP